MGADNVLDIVRECGKYVQNDAYGFVLCKMRMIVILWRRRSLKKNQVKTGGQKMS